MTFAMPIAFVCFAFAAAFVGAKQRRRSVARERDTVQPNLRYLIHAINDDRCTGCQTCVDACPTNVLELVAHKSRATRFEECVQCEKCSRACPTNALAMHLIGDSAPMIKVPDLDDNFQTKIPGQYLIGEVAGKPLVKNAANLGRLVVEHITQSGLVAHPAPTATTVDVVIVGSGPGGLSAAMTCVRHGLSYVVLEKERIMAATVLRYPAGKPFMAEPHDCRNLSFLPVFTTSKEELVQTWQELVSTLNMRVQLDEAADSIRNLADGTFEVTTRKATYSSQRVVLAIGVRGKPRTLNVPGEEQRKVHMLLEDPNDHSGLNVLVVGGGDSALEAAVALAGVGATVTLSYRKKEFSRAKAKNRADVDRLVQTGAATVLFKSGVKEIGRSDVTITLASGETTTVANDATFILIGADPPVKWLRKHGVEVIERPHSYSAGATDELILGVTASARECANSARDAFSAIKGRVRRRLPMPLSARASGAVTSVVTLPPPVPPKRRASTVGVFAKRLRDAVSPNRHRQRQRNESAVTFVARLRDSRDSVVAPMPRPPTVNPFDGPTNVDIIPPVMFSSDRHDRSDRYEA